jgi:alcohol dehydrogenase class IV
MWFFRSPIIAFGEDALSHLTAIQGHRALIVTDHHIVTLGFVDRVQEKLTEGGIASEIFADVEPNPCVETVQRGAAAASAYGPDWIVAVGGGSAIDAAKAIWVLYELPGMSPWEVAPMGDLGLRQKARLIAIPTTSGTGAETTWPYVLTDAAEHCKRSAGHPDDIPDLVIVDPSFVINLPAQITADTGMDALTHAVEGYTSLWRNDFADGMCLKAIQLVLDYLPRAYEDGSNDPEAREKMHNAATIAGLGFGNSMAAMAHAMGHSLGALFPIPHGRAVGLLLPYVIEFTARGDEPNRYGEMARFLGLPAGDAAEGTASLVGAIRDLARRIGQPTSLQEAGMSLPDFQAQLAKLVENAANDSALVVSTRYPAEEEIERVYRYAYEGKAIDF